MMFTKQIAKIIVGVTLIVSCSTDERETSIQDDPTREIINSIRSYEEAQEIAQNAVSLLDSESDTRSSVHQRKIAQEGKIVYKLDAKTRSNGIANDTLIYVFNFENNDGFALVSASRATEGLLAVTEKGHCNPEEQSGIEGFDLFIEMAKDYVANANIRSLEPIDSLMSISVEYEYTHNIVGPYVNVRWGQTHTEGEFCPNNICGCASTAMAQVMSYYEYPGSMTITYPESDQTFQVFDWPAMKNHLTHHYLAACFSDNVDVHKSIGRLCRQLGFISNSEYHTDGTGTWTYTSDLKSTMNYYGYNTYGWYDFDNSYACQVLDNENVIIMYGNHQGTNGHFWVFDGYDAATYYIYTYTYVEGGSERELTRVSGPHSVLLNHLNWGWYGVNNGYFLSNVFDPSQVQFPDTNSNYATTIFDTNLKTLTISANW